MTPPAYVQPDGVVTGDHRIKGKSYAEFPKLNRDRPGVGSALQHRNGKFSADQKAGFFAVGGDQIGFGQNLEQVVLLKRFDERPQIQIGAKGENIESVGDVKRTFRLLPRRPGRCQSTEG